MRYPPRLIVLGLLVGMALVAALLLTGGVVAQSTETETQVQWPPPPEPGVSNQTCLSCHAQPDQYLELPSGEQLYLTVDEEEYNASVHGKTGYACVQCHTNITEYPHPPLTAQTRREVTLNYYQSCVRCHSSMYEKTLDSTHQKALAEGNQDAAVCTDCHGSHNVQPPDDPTLTADQSHHVLRPIAQAMTDNNIDLWVCPPTIGPAPKGLDATGDPVMCLPWTQIGFPAINIPTTKNEEGLPMGLQLVGAWNSDESLLAWAPDIEKAVRTI